GAGENNNATGDLDLLNDGGSSAFTLTIKGAGANKTTIDAKGIDRVFHLRQGARVILQDLTITGGVARDDGSPGPGHALGGGLYDNGAVQVTLTNVTFSGNKALAPAGASNPAGAGGAGFNALGGGAFFGGATTVLSGIVADGNSAISGAGGAGGVVAGVGQPG